MTIDEKIFELNKLGFTSPLVEVDGIYSIMKRDPNYYGVIENARYKQYAILWFNLLREIWEEVEAVLIESHDEIRDAMHRHLYIEEVIKQHGEWFFDDKTNEAAYGKEFYKFVKGVYESPTA